MCCNPPLVNQLNDLVQQVGDCCAPISCGPTVINQLQGLVKQVGGGMCCAAGDACCNTAPCCPPCCPQTKPFAQVTMVVPPPCFLPTRPEPVEPLKLPNPCTADPCLTQEQAIEQRYSNFYNNYNIQYRNDGTWYDRCSPPAPPQKREMPPNCEDYTKRPMKPCQKPGCPTGFKPCKMKMIPPPGCDPHLPWIAKIQKCPPKPKVKPDTFYNPGKCCRPCCLHVKEKKPCCYPKPCKAHCYNHPPEMRAVWFEFN